MVELHTASHRFLRRTTLTGLAFLAGALYAPSASAHHHRPHRGRVQLARAVGRVHPAHVRPGSYTPPFSVYAVDGNSGRVLYQKDENAPRHPASITKVMTLYLLFEQLHQNRLTLDTRIDVSAHAASQEPTKLGLRAGSTIRIEDAVKAIVTKSANDMAVAIAERIGGDEPGFARLMTRKAHALGMSRSNFVNASGLPDEAQLTTAHDLVILGRAIHDRFPNYYHFFSTPSFRYAGQFMANHNHLMEQVQGMDGIKTGYTRMSGFNLLSSVNRNGHWLVAVVLGGKTRLGRDRIMADLISSEIDHCATTRTAAAISEDPALEQVAEAIPVIQHEGQFAPPVEAVDDDAAERSTTPTRAAAGEEDSGPAVTEAKAGDDKASPQETPAAVSVPAPVSHARPAPAKPVQVANLPTEPALSRPRPAFVSGLPHIGDHDMTATGSIRPRESHVDGSTTRYNGATTTTPSALRHLSRREHPATPTKKVDVASLDPKAGVPSARPVLAHSAWMIQIGATPTIAKANELIERAKTGSQGALSAARPFTEKVQKGKDTLYRARFAGLEASSAEAACRNLKRAGISCFATRN